MLQLKPYKTHNIHLYKTYSTLPIDLLHNYQIFMHMHKYVFHKEQTLPSVFLIYFMILDKNISFILILYFLNMEKEL